MGHKDHLGTPEEDLRRRQKDLKKVTSTAYQGNPPVFTEGLDQIGLVARTTGEVRDTDFPLLFNIDDQAQGFNLDTYNLDLSKQDAMFHRIIIGDLDEFSAAILNVDVNFINLPKNKELQFTIEFVKDPAIVTDPTVTFSPALQGVPAGFPDDFAVWYFLISARTLPDNTTRFELLNVGTGSGPGNTFPILYPEETIGSIGGPTQNINISGTDGHFKEFTLTGNVNLTFSGFPAGTVLEEFWILVNQDGVGGHSLTATGSTLKNAGTLDSLLDKTALAQTLFHFVTGDAGTTLHAELVDLVASGGGFSGLLSDLVIDVNKDWNGKSIDNLAGIDLFANAVANSVANAAIISFISDAAASRGQFGRSDFFGTAQGLAANVMAGDNFVLAVDTVAKFQMSSALSQFRLSFEVAMLGNPITSIDFLESASANLPGVGFIRMAVSDDIVSRNDDNSDNLLIGAGLDFLGNDAWEFTVEGGIRMTISKLNVDVKTNNIVNTANILPAPGSHDIGAFSPGDSYTDVIAKFFRPDEAAVISFKHAFAKNNEEMYVNYIDQTPAEANAGFAIKEEGVTLFKFSSVFTDVRRLFIGSDPFVSGEKYEIVMGENSNSSASISFIEGGTDLFLNREGVSTNQGVSLQSRGVTRLRATILEIGCFAPVNVNSNEILNARLISADNSGLSTLGETVTFDGGFNVFLRSRMAFAGDPDTFIQMSGTGINITSDDDVIISSGTNSNVIIASDEQMNIFVTDASGLTITIGGGFPEFIFQDNALIIDGSIDVLLQGGSIELLAGALQGYMQLEELGGVPSTPASGFGRLFADNLLGAETPFWIDSSGLVSNLLLASGGITTWKLPVRAKADGFNFFFPNIQQITDGVTLAIGDRILQTDELNAVNNGIWELTGSFSGVPLQALLIRPDDFNSDDDMLSETFVAVEEGDVNRNTLWHLITDNPILDAVTDQTWVQFSGAGGGTVGGANGLFITKSTDQVHASGGGSQTFEQDDEWRFIPNADTLFFIELNFRYTSPSATFEVGVECGADATYQIVSGIALGGQLARDWSDPSASLVEVASLPGSGLPSTEEDSQVTPVYIILETFSDVDEIIINVRAGIGTSFELITHRGSTMQVFGEGVGGTLPPPSLQMLELVARVPGPLTIPDKSEDTPFIIKRWKINPNGNPQTRLRFFSVIQSYIKSNVAGQTIKVAIFTGPNQTTGFISRNEISTNSTTSFANSISASNTVFDETDNFFVFGGYIQNQGIGTTGELENAVIAAQIYLPTGYTLEEEI